MNVIGLELAGSTIVLDMARFNSKSTVTERLPILIVTPVALLSQTQLNVNVYPVIDGGAVTLPLAAVLMENSQGATTLGVAEFEALVQPERKPEVLTCLACSVAGLLFIG